MHAVCWLQRQHDSSIIRRCVIILHRVIIVVWLAVGRRRRRDPAGLGSFVYSLGAERVRHRSRRYSSGEKIKGALDAAAAGKRAK